MKHLIIISVIFFCFSIASAHSGRLDSSGGHYNRKTGEYHYHKIKPLSENFKKEPKQSSKPSKSKTKSSKSKRK
ncbi:MAG: YHYH domain-containing protein [Nitrospinae bacterium]|nr:YHYH domain-containing protein [Nitrospinota bacterium]